MTNMQMCVFYGIVSFLTLNDLEGHLNCLKLFQTAICWKYSGYLPWRDCQQCDYNYNYCNGI